MNLVRLSILLCTLLLVAVGSGRAQPSAPEGGAAPLDLTAAQKQTIYQSVSKTQNNNAAPTGFPTRVGAVVPTGIRLAPVPATIVELVPQTKGLEAALVEGEVVLVEPQGKRVVAVITPERRD